MLYVHAPGGTGKSALLHRFADEAQAADRQVTWLDARLIERSPSGFQAAATGLDGEGQVLLVDTFEACQGMEGWFWHVFLPSLPTGTLVVVASRQPPDLLQSADPAWSAVTQVIALKNLSKEAAVDVLRRRDVPREFWTGLYDATDGHPLALVLAAEVALRDGSSVGHWMTQDPAIKTLLDRLIGDLPSPLHRRALEVCAQAYTTREDLLRFVFGDEAPELFSWLRAQPYIEAGPAGLHPHDLVRDLLIADLRWRDPSGWQSMHSKIRPYFLQQAVRARGPEVLPSQMALSYLHRNGAVMGKYITWRGQGEVYETQYRPEHRDAVLAMAAKTASGAEMTALRFWLDRQPESLYVYCRPTTGEPAAFVAWLDLWAPDDVENRADPTIAAIWRHAQHNGAPRPDRKLAVQRFIVFADGPAQPGPVFDLVAMRCVAVCMRETNLAWTFVTMPDPDFWAPLLEYVDHRRLDGDLSAVFAHDWWSTPMEAWLELLLNRLFHGPEIPPSRDEFVALPRDEFGAAVREALRNWRHPSSFATSPLLQSKLAGAGDLEARTEALRAEIEDAVDTLQGTVHREKLHRVLAVTFFHGSVTQEAAAARIGIPFGTYRHRLAAGLDLLIEELWRREAAVTSGL
ncbi:hypothetical protein AB0F72_27650 [Actinoplanes sp. NPDC023936]|uniref:hypothetical protein n=1 Tax=Actinoplanes sp. NPDC023936 TaxID=3154910 RepID=UPI0033D1BCA9